MTAALFDGLATLIVGTFAEDVIYVNTGETLSAKVRTDFIEVNDGETYKQVKFLHFAEDDLSDADVTLAVDDTLTVRGDTYKVLDTSSTGRGITQVRLGAVV